MVVLNFANRPAIHCSVSLHIRLDSRVRKSKVKLRTSNRYINSIPIRVVHRDVDIRGQVTARELGSEILVHVQRVVVNIQLVTLFPPVSEIHTVTRMKEYALSDG